MKSKFKIKGSSNVSDSVGINTSQITSHLGMSKLQDPYKLEQQNTCANFEKKVQGSNDISNLEDNSPKNSNKVLKMNNIKTLFKSINKFKQVHTRSKTMQKTLNKYRVNSNVNVFTQKISRSTYKSRVDLCQSQKKEMQNFFNHQGIEVPFALQISQILLNTIIFLLMFVFLSLGVVFYQQIHNSVLVNFQIVCTIFTLANIVFNFVTVGVSNGKRVDKIGQIAVNYLKGQFIFDFLCFIALFVDLLFQKGQVKFLRFLFLLKFSDFKRNIQKLEYYFINTFYKEQYWGICHLITSNFLVAHIIAIILLLFLQIDPNHNWLTKAGIDNVQWYEQYVWAYYWAVTTMLSIGYGDITVANYRQAIYMVFVQIFSCIILAYTINSVGNLIQKLRSQDLQKNKNLKIFKQIADKNKLPRKLKQKVNSYINQTIQIKTKFNYEDQKKLMNELPPDARKSIMKQCNSKLFLNISIFKSMSYKAIAALANKIQMKIAHPQEIIYHPNNPYQLQILKQGKVGYFACQDKFRRKYCMNQLKVNTKDQSKCLFLNFLSGTQPKYTICSMSYSVIYYLPLQQLLEILKAHKNDNQKYSVVRDKSKHVLNQFQLIRCDCCNTNHTRVDCPRCHYMPLKDIVVAKYLHAKKQKNCERVKFNRQKTDKNSYRSKMYIKTFKQQIKCIKHSKLQSLNTVTQYVISQLLGLDHKYHALESQSKEQEGIKIKNMNPKSSIQLNSLKKRTKSFNLKKLYQVTTEIINQCRFTRLQKIDKPNYLLSQIQRMMGLECDHLHDFIVYFPRMNPKQISKKFKYMNQKQKIGKAIKSSKTLKSLKLIQ